MAFQHNISGKVQFPAARFVYNRQNCLCGINRSLSLNVAEKYNVTMKGAISCPKVALKKILATLGTTPKHK